MNVFDAQRLFRENVERIDPQADPVTWNLNSGLLAVADELLYQRQLLERISQLAKR